MYLEAIEQTKQHAKKKKQQTLVVLPTYAAFDMLSASVLSRTTGGQRVLAGTETLPWATRTSRRGERCEILGTKEQMTVAVTPHAAAPRVCSELDDLLGVDCINNSSSSSSSRRSSKRRKQPRYVACASFLVSTLQPTFCFHPAIMYGQWSSWDGGVTPLKRAPLFYQGWSEAPGALLLAMGNEVLRVRDELLRRYPALNLDGLYDTQQFLIRAYGNDIKDKRTMGTCLRSNTAYDGLVHPVVKSGGGSGTVLPNFKARYLAEDVPLGLCCARGIAELAGVRTPTIDRVLLWCQRVMHKEFLVPVSSSSSSSSVLYTLVGSKHLAETRAPQRFGYTTLDAMMQLYLAAPPPLFKSSL
jgi:hypothetical protein